MCYSDKIFFNWIHFKTQYEQLFEVLKIHFWNLSKQQSVNIMSLQFLQSKSPERCSFCLKIVYTAWHLLCFSVLILNDNYKHFWDVHPTLIFMTNHNTFKYHSIYIPHVNCINYDYFYTYIHICILVYMYVWMNVCVCVLRYANESSLHNLKFTLIFNYFIINK